MNHRDIGWARSLRRRDRIDGRSESADQRSPTQKTVETKTIFPQALFERPAVSRSWLSTQKGFGNIKRCFVTREIIGRLVGGEVCRRSDRTCETQGQFLIARVDRTTSHFLEHRVSSRRWKASTRLRCSRTVSIRLPDELLRDAGSPRRPAANRKCRITQVDALAEAIVSSVSDATRLPNVVHSPLASCAGLGHGPHRRREVGEGRTARQPGQVRKEAALTRQGGSLSNLPLMRACRQARARARARVGVAFAAQSTFERNLRCSDIDSSPAREA